ncbi:DNase I-like protein [Fistulina hepatica ATCC 64428]|uniref:DNase I-like protein n=1 Tax=Fistulina hepatica ATCC 64428 TaxID=1128425 RepID=A0A0D7A683_9AGAR|nr:DNase I-like protein [Fistulina hepatica ATCC 64428]
MQSLLSLVLLFSVFASASATTIARIQGPAFLSPLEGQSVSNVTGLVTAKSSSGFWLAGDAVDDDRVSTGLYVYTTSSSVLSEVAVGDEITLSGTVAEYRSSSRTEDLHVTELEDPSNINVISTGNIATPVVLGQDRSPPTTLLSALDVGDDGFLSVPNDQYSQEGVNATLIPNTYGLDFWESIEGRLVKIPSPVAVSLPNSYGEFWVHGNWSVTGKNSRGGLTLITGSDGYPDGNPEAIIIGSPLDDADNPSVAIGFNLSDITGVVHYEYGFYYVLPLTAPTVSSTPSSTVPITTITSDSNDTCIITIGDYNVDNLAPTSDTMAGIGEHIAIYLQSPNIVFLQEIQDNSGPTDDGTVDANETLTAVVDAISSAGSVTYSFTKVDPENDTDGGETGGNIRQAFLYDPEKVTLIPGTAGNASEAIVVSNDNGKPVLSYNPGRIDPTNPAWNDSRKPLVAEWQTSNGTTLFTVNLHLVSKLDSSSLLGDPRPPINSPVDQRTSQVEVVADFTQQIPDIDSSANIVVGGDCNEFIQTTTVFESLTTVVTHVDDAAGIEDVEQYTYTYSQNSEQLDHLFVSSAIAARGVDIEHIHVNTWALDLDDQKSDHDPSIAKIAVC